MLNDINPTNVVKIIDQLKCKNSCDLWDVSMSLIKKVRYEIASPLALVINYCIQNGSFPDVLKMAKVIPLFKKGALSDANNYRPISLLPVFSKIFEKYIANELYTFIETHKILNSRQFGFQRKKNTTNAIVSLLERVLWDLDSSKNTYGLFCDLSKAFDCVSHKILLLKLEHYGVRNRELSIFTSYLENRKQVLECNGIKSHTNNMEMGVPQGSILGPLLFILYINDLVVCVENEKDIVLFADDTTVVVSDKIKENVCIKLDILIGNIKNWFNANNLLLNVEKTNIIRFFLGTGHSIDMIKNTIDKHFIKSIDHIKFLGIIIDSKLIWNKHIDTLVGKLKSAVYAIKTIRQLSDIKSAKTVYHAYFHSIMSYGILAWGNASDSSRIFILQKRAIRSILFMKNIESCRDKFKELGIMTMTGEFIYQNLMYVKLNIDNFKLNSDLHEHNTRHKNNLSYPRRRLAKVGNSYLCISIKLYNKLDQDVQQLNDAVFSNRIRRLLIEKSYYTLDEAFADDFCTL